MFSLCTRPFRIGFRIVAVVMNDLVLLFWCVLALLSKESKLSKVFFLFSGLLEGKSKAVNGKGRFVYCEQREKKNTECERGRCLFGWFRIFVFEGVYLGGSGMM